ncbi:MAG: 30S ribosomal protein S12 methylthiotransferase RimO [Deltaproteobacteria bacterium]|nr:30S ribosomal protein S12 methylthiotransferase RimO [Deltaproteobacteria bacterium]
MAKVHFVSLGCPKNRVDAEHMLGISVEGGHSVVEDPDQADTIVINTCGFIGEAKKESIEAILEMGAVKAKTGARLVVSGCMVQRYVGELERELPEIDAFLGTSDYARIGEVLGPAASTTRSSSLLRVLPSDAVEHQREHVHGDEHEHAQKLISPTPTFVAGCELPRVNSMPRYTAYLKIAEGCDNACAFCIIPELRGAQRSRSIDDLVKEATRLADGGVVELNLVAQDLSGYGHDLPHRPTLAALLAALARVPGLRWVRCMYLYPRTLSDGLLAELDRGANALPYLDIPTQHGSDRMLRLMRRGKDQRRLTELLTGVRASVRHAVLRTSVIVGFPGEEDQDFQRLLDFAEAVRFERLGVFKYSDEEGTAAFALPHKVSAAKKRSRHDKLMRRQRRIHEEKSRALIGTVHEAIVEGRSEEHELLVKGRLWSQAPEIDGSTYLSSARTLHTGEIVHVVVTDVKDYDVVAEVLDHDDPRVAESVPFACRR